MTPEDALPAIAEIAVTIGGFTGILIALQAGGIGRTEGQAFRIVVILLLPANVLLCSLLPFALAGLSESPRVVWGVPLCAHALLGGALAANSYLRFARGDLKAVTFPVMGQAALAISVLLQLPNTQRTIAPRADKRRTIV